MMDFISLCDGRTSLLQIADRLNVAIWDLYEFCDNLEEHDLLRVNRTIFLNTVTAIAHTTCDETKTIQ